MFVYGEYTTNIIYNIVWENSSIVYTRCEFYELNNDSRCLCKCRYVFLSGNLNRIIAKLPTANTSPILAIMHYYTHHQISDHHWSPIHTILCILYSSAERFWSSSSISKIFLQDEIFSTDQLISIAVF